MRFPQNYVIQNGQAVSAAITGSAVTVAGPTLDSGASSLVAGAVVVAAITANTMTLTGKWQVSVGGTFVDVVESNNPANVVFATGTGTIATTTKVFSAPLAVTAGSRLARFVVTNAVAAGAGGSADTVTIGYDYRAPVSAYGS